MVSGTSSALLDMATRNEYFKEDEMAKWFGLYIESSNPGRIARIIETARYTELAEKSATVCQQCKASVPEHHVICWGDWGRKIDP